MRSRQESEEISVCTTPSETTFKYHSYTQSSEPIEQERRRPNTPLPGLFSKIHNEEAKVIVHNEKTTTKCCCAVS